MAISGCVLCNKDADSLLHWPWCGISNTSTLFTGCNKNVEIVFSLISPVNNTDRPFDLMDNTTDASFGDV